MVAFKAMDLNHFSHVIGILVATEMEALNTSNSRSPTLVFRPSKCQANCLAERKVAHPLKNFSNHGLCLK
jgi:hypothetical protein